MRKKQGMNARKIAQNYHHHVGGKEKASKHYGNNKERLQEQARNKYRELSNEGSDIKREY